jgi:hypothetical protein
MEVLMEYVPTAAERLRSLVLSASSLDVVAAGRRVHLMDSHIVDADGRVRIAVPADGALALDLADGPLPALIDITDVAPVAMRDRIRARATLAGAMTIVGPGPDGRAAAPLATTFDLAAADLTERDGVTHIEPAEFAGATADLLASRESALLCHLVDAHADLVSWLARLVPAARLHGVTRVHPLRLDRFGIVLRLEFPSTDRDVRLPFTSPVRSVDEAPSRMLELLARARACRRRVA